MTETLKDTERPTTDATGKAEVDPKVEEVYRKLIQFAEHSDRQSWLNRRNDNWKAAIENEILTPEDIAELAAVGIKTPFNINRCNKGVQGKSAIATAENPEIKFLPIGSADKYLAELLNRGFAYVWHRNEGNQVGYDFVEENTIGGASFIEAAFEESTLQVLKDRQGNPASIMLGKIRLIESPPEDIYFDAQSRARDFSDTDIIKAKLRSKKYLKENYDDLKEWHLRNYYNEIKKNLKSSGVTSGDNYAEADKTGKDSFDSTKEHETNNIWEIEAWMLKTVKEPYLISEDGKQYRKLEPGEKIEAEKDENGIEYGTDEAGNRGILWTLKKTQRELRIIVGTQLVESEINPEGEDADGDPVVRLIGMKYQRTRSAYPMSPTDYALPVNRAKAKAQHQLQLTLAHNANSPIVESKGVVWSGNPGTPGSKATVPTTSIPGQAVTRLQPGSFQANHFFTLEQKYDQDIDDQYDVPDVMRGKIPPGQDGIAARSILALQDTVGVMSKPFMAKYESALVRLARPVMALMLRHWPPEMWTRLIEPDEWNNWEPMDRAEADTEEVDPEVQAKITANWERALAMLQGEQAITLADLDIRIAAGSSMPTNRIGRSMEALERVKMGVYDTKAYLDYIDDPKSDEIAARIAKRDQQMMQAGIQKQGGK